MHGVSRRAPLLLAAVLALLVASAAFAVWAADEAHPAPLTEGVAGWGANSDGEIGDGTTTMRLAPVTVSALAQSTQLAIGTADSLGVLADGTVMAWGENTYGQLGRGTDVGPESCGEFSCSTVPLAVPSLHGVTAVAAGAGHDLALLANGTVMAWGENEDGQLGLGTVSGPSLCSRYATACATTPTPIPGLEGVKAIAAGDRYSLALLGNGRVMSWGQNDLGQLGNGSAPGSTDAPAEVPGLSEVVAIAAGSDHALALLADGTVMAWGYNADGELGDGDGGPYFSAEPVPVSGLSEVRAITAGDDQSLALLKNGTARAWGDNIYGQLGDDIAGPEECEPQVFCARTPVEVEGLTHLSALEAAGLSGYAIREDRTAVSWGFDNAGQLGLGEGGGLETCSGIFICARAPHSLSGIADASEIAGGLNSVLARLGGRTPVERATYANWALSGELTPKLLGQPLALPAGSTFNGSGELNTETGAGTVTGNVSIPPFTASFRLFGALPTSLGMKLTQAAPLEGSATRGEGGTEQLSLPMSLNVAVTSIGLLGLTLPTRCSAVQPLALGLLGALSREELLASGWSFSGAAAIPKFKCEGGLLGAAFGQILSALLSGPQATYSLRFAPPGH